MTVLADNTTMISYPLPGGDDAGYIEVKAIEDPSGHLRDEIIIVLPLLAGENHEADELDDDPLYYYPKKQHGGDDSDTDSESDSDSDDDDEGLDQFDDENPRYNRNALALSKESKEMEYSFMEELMSTLDSIFGCSYAAACTDAMTSPSKVLKSALRRKSDADTCTPPINRSVSFTRLEIREFNMTLGNHPSAVTGPPVMLDWAPPAREAIIDLDMYEQARKPRRNRRQLKLSFEARRGILENERGFTVEEVKQAWSEALKIRKQRQETRLQGPHQRMMDEFWESAVRKYNRLFEWKLSEQ